MSATNRSSEKVLEDLQKGAESLECSALVSRETARPALIGFKRRLNCFTWNEAVLSGPCARLLFHVKRSFAGDFGALKNALGARVLARATSRERLSKRQTHTEPTGRHPSRRPGGRSRRSPSIVVGLRRHLRLRGSSRWPSSRARRPRRQPRRRPRSPAPSPS